MIDDFKPTSGPAPSLRDKLSSRNETPKATGEDFQTPDEIAAADDLEQPVEPAGQGSGKSPRTGGPGKDWRSRLALHWPPGKKEWLVVAAIVLLGGLGTLLILTHHHNKPIIAAKPAKPKPVQPTTVASTLSGLQVDPSLNKLPVTGVMVENSLDARPQSGLSQAMVVFEAVAEGGITRFLALYQDTSPGSVGPIRSARPYYVAWALGFDAGYAHVGGSPDALADLRTWSNVRDLDQFHNSAAYQRIPTRPAPHNVYTSISRLNQLEASKGYTSSNFAGFTRKAPAPAKQPNAKAINLTVSGASYNVHYDYVVAANSYDRSEGGSPQNDANDGARISPKVVIAMVIPQTNGALDASGAYYSNYTEVGSGPVYVFQDGTVTTGQWAKAGVNNQIIFTDGAGKPLKLNPGQTWLTAVNAAAKVTYTP